MTPEEITARLEAAVAAAKAAMVELEAAIAAASAAMVELESAIAVARGAMVELQAALDAYVDLIKPDPGPGPEPEPDPGKVRWLSGMDPNRDDSPFGELAAFEKWRTLPVKGMLTFHGRGFFGPGKKWSAMHASFVVQPGGQIDRVLSHENGYFVTHAQPLLIDSQKQQFSLLTAGVLDDDHRAVAKSIARSVRDRWDRFFLRLGWEANKGSYPWCLDAATPKELAHYAEGWARIARIYKEESGGKVQIVWNHLKDSSTPIAKFYPGDDVVDIVGVDPYDNGQSLGSGFVNDEASWEKFLGSYDRATGMVRGIKGFRDFAIEHDKGIAYCEWGASNQSGTEPLREDGSNNDFYARKMLLDWFPSLGKRLVYENYFNGPDKHKVFPRQDILGKVSDAYLAACKELAKRGSNQ